MTREEAEQHLRKPEGFRDQRQLPEEASGIYGRDVLTLNADPLPIIGVSGEAEDGDDHAIEDKDLSDDS